jgi:hypothetical protein
LVGILFLWLPLAIGGIVQGNQLQNSTPFAASFNTSLLFLRISTIGDLLLLGSHVLFLVNVFGISNRYWRSRAAVAIAAVTAEIEPVPL